MNKRDTQKTKLHKRVTALRHALSGIPLPATERDIVAYAQNKGADNAVMNALTALPSGVYAHESEIIAQLIRQTNHSL